MNGQGRRRQSGTGTTTGHPGQGWKRKCKAKQVFEKGVYQVTDRKRKKNWKLVYRGRITPKDTDGININVGKEIKQNKKVK